ncbi:hypothetical protein ACN4DJ_05765 [Corynebacterium macclintockiae]|uniref:hypothetical protein n=1 Tax=Corynebacterium macclintockiae TaxID=2913501 RepID=UPI003EC0019C
MATDGELTVVRRLAGYAYGQWNVDWPESVPEEQRPKLADDREHGYVHRLGSGSGRMGRRFVRADVSVTAAEYDKNGRVPHTGYSNVEDVLDAAVAQTDEDALVERAITRDGLGVLRPGVDFRVGDLVEVMIWGCAVPLPVTAIEAVTEAGAVVDWRVTVGGQVVSDDVERKRANADLERAVWGERRERLKVAREASEAKAAAAAADRRAGDAQSSADAAQSSADQAGQGVQNLQEILAGKNATAQDVTDQLAALNAQLQARDEPTGPLIPAYIAANTKRWELQEKVDKQQDYVSDLLAWQVRALEESVQWHRSLAPFTFAISHGDTKNVHFIRAEVTDQSSPKLGNMTITNTSDWIDARVSIGYDSSAVLGDNSFGTVETVLKAGESREVGTVGGFIGAYSAFYLVSVDPQPRRTYVPPAPPSPPK